jgi:hypothetical protein
MATGRELPRLLGTASTLGREVAKPPLLLSVTGHPVFLLSRRSRSGRRSQDNAIDPNITISELHRRRSGLPTFMSLGGAAELVRRKVTSHHRGSGRKSWRAILAATRACRLRWAPRSYGCICFEHLGAQVLIDIACQEIRQEGITHCVVVAARTKTASARTFSSGQTRARGRSRRNRPIEC